MGETGSSATDSETPEPGNMLLLLLPVVEQSSSLTRGRAEDKDVYYSASKRLG